MRSRLSVTEICRGSAPCNPKARIVRKTTNPRQKSHRKGTNRSSVTGSDCNCNVRIMQPTLDLGWCFSAQRDLRRLGRESIREPYQHQAIFIAEEYDPVMCTSVQHTFEISKSCPIGKSRRIATWEFIFGKVLGRRSLFENGG